MPEIMSDREFIQYCRTHCETPRAAFVPAQIARLYRLAGDERAANYWSKEPNQIMDGWKYRVLDLLDKIANKGTTP